MPAKKTITIPVPTRITVNRKHPEQCYMSEYGDACSHMKPPDYSKKGAVMLCRLFRDAGGNPTPLLKLDGTSALLGNPEILRCKACLDAERAQAFIEKAE